MKSKEEKEIEKTASVTLSHAIFRVEFEFRLFWTVTRCDWSKVGRGRCVGY